MATSLVKAFTAVGVGGAIQIKRGNSFTYVVSNTFVGTWKVEKSVDQGQTWDVVASGTATRTILTVPIDLRSHSAALVRFHCTVYTSGTITTTIAAVEEVVAQFPNIEGASQLTINDTGVLVPGNLAVTGASTLTGAAALNGGAAVASSLALASIEDTLTAHAGGTQALALALSATNIVHRVTTVGTAADSVALPAATGSGKIHIVANAAAANSMQVFGQATETINGITSTTGVAVAAGKSAIFVDFAAGAWFMLLSA